MKKIILTAALFAALNINLQAQTKVNNPTPQYIGKKCPDCKELTKWHYDRTGFVETITNPELNSWIKIDWTAKTVTVTDGTEYRLEFTTNALRQSQTYWYGGQKLTVYFDKNAEYIGHEIED